MASSAVKKKQKMKGKTLNLNEFLADDSGTSGPGSSYVLAAKPLSWGEQMDNQEIEGDDLPEYGMSRGPAIDRSKLPSAPRAARGADFDPSRLPTRPPYTAFLGNLQYDICEEDIEQFFMKLKLVNIRLPQEQGRMKGFGYAEFEDRESLIDALALNDTLLNNRKVRIDLAEQNQGTGGDRDRGQWREGDEDRTTGDWRTKPASHDSFGDDRYGGRSGGGGYDDRGSDRGRFGDRDRYGGDRGGDRFGGDRYGGDRYGGDRSGDRYGGGGGSRYGGDRGGDRFGSDRYGGGRDSDRYGGGRDSDRYGGDRGGDRSRYDDRDQGYGRRQFGTGFHSGGDRDSYRSGGDRDSYRTGGDSYGSNSYDRERTGDRPDSDREPKERPRLQLKPRTKPVEEPQTQPQAQPQEAPKKSASIFGGAKPVDTAAREREIEERLFRERHLSDKPAEPPRGAPRQQTSTGSSGDRPHTRRDSGSSAEGSSTSSTRRERLSSSGSSKGIRTVAPPPGAGSARVRSDSTLSDDANAFEDDRHQRTSPKKASEPAPMIVPAPPPKTNIWEKRKSETKVTQQLVDQREERKSSDGGDGSSKVCEKEPERQKEEKEQENRETKESLQTTEVGKAPQDGPPVNVWEKRQKERSADHPEIQTTTSKDGQ